MVELELEAELGGEDSNSYVTVEDARLHAAYSVTPNARNFLHLSEPDQIKALVTAAREIDTLGDTFLGDRSTSTQALEWPRDDGTLPVNLVRANIELAISYAPALKPGYSGDVLNPSLSDGQIKRIQIGPIEKEWFEPRTTEATAFERLPAVVQRLLSSLIYQPSSGWGSAVVTRGS